MDADDGDHRGVVVGVDGSEPALRAVRWAAAEAHLRGLPLHIVHTADPAAPGGAADVLLRAFTIAARAYSTARRTAPEVTVSTSRTARDPADSLLRAAVGATVLVVGTGGGDARGGLLTAAVALDVVGRSACPVVTVRGAPVPAHGTPGT